HSWPGGGTLPTTRRVGGGASCRCRCTCHPNRPMTTPRSLFWSDFWKHEDKCSKTWSRSRLRVRSGEDLSLERSIRIWTCARCHLPFETTASRRGKGGANPYYPPLQTVGGSKPTATAAAERKHGNSFARGLAGGMITNSRGQRADEDSRSVSCSTPRARGCLP